MEKIDIYGKHINLTLNNSEKIKTNFGGCMTIVSFIFTFAIIWFIGNDIIYKKNPLTITDHNIFDNYTEININSSKIPFGISLTDDDNNLINLDHYFNITLKYVKYTVEFDKAINTYKTHKYILRNLKAIRCNLTMFYQKINEKQFNDSQLGEFFCPFFENVKLGGYWTDPEQYLLSISISKCNKKTKNNGCKSIEEIDNYIKKNRLNFNINFLQPKFQFNNFQVPVTYSVMNYFRYLTSNSLKYSYFNVEKNELYTDSGFAIESFNQKEIYEAVFMTTDELDFNVESQELLVVEIYSSNKNKVYTRSYIKLGNILASFGGILKLFFSIFVFLNSVFSRIRFLEVIINEVFLIKENKLTSRRRKSIFTVHNIDMKNFELLSRKDFMNRYLLNIDKKNSHLQNIDKKSDSIDFKNLDKEEKNDFLNNLNQNNTNNNKIQNYVRFQDSFENKFNNRIQNEVIRDTIFEEFNQKSIYLKNIKKAKNNLCLINYNHKNNDSTINESNYRYFIKSKIKNLKK